MAADGKLFGAVEAGGTKFACAVGYAPDEVVKTQTFPTTAPNETFKEMLAFFEGAARELGEFAGLGVASFGPIDIDRASPTYGSLQKTPKPGWEGANFIEALTPLGAPVRVDTDVNGAGLGEATAVSGRGLRTIAYVTVGTGIGAGVIQDGVPQAGFSHFELGHITPPRDEARDPYPGLCPFHGDCLEGLASGPAILKRWGAALSDLPADHEAHDLEAEYLAHLAVALTYGHMPDRIIFGGGVMKTPGLVERLRRETKTLIGDYIETGPLAGDLSDYIVPPALGDLAGLVGAMALARLAYGERQ